MPRLRKRSILLSGHATSMALESEFWAVLDEMALARGVSLAGLIAQIDEGRSEGRLDLAHPRNVTCAQAGRLVIAVALDQQAFGTTVQQDDAAGFTNAAIYKEAALAHVRTNPTPVRRFMVS